MISPTPVPPPPDDPNIHPSQDVSKPESSKTRTPPHLRYPRLGAISAFFSFLCTCSIAFLFLLGWATHLSKEPGSLEMDKVLIIPSHIEPSEIIDQLTTEGVVDSSFLMNLVLLSQGHRTHLKSGEYLFKAHTSLQDVIDQIVQGRQILHSITIPEGLTSEQIVQRLSNNEFLAGEIKDLPKEGILLPETYKFSRGHSRAALLRKMQEDQRKLLEQIWARRAQGLPLRTPSELVTLASIVEKETGKSEERPRIARVFMNRLVKRMKLQSDPTIVYGLVGGRGTLGRGITKTELSFPTPYNTYVIDGLPPGPITNPGRASLEAVANPLVTNDLYFVADGTGGHVFTDNLQQHNLNVMKWRQIEKENQERGLTSQPNTSSSPTTPVDHASPQDIPAGGAMPIVPQKKSDVTPRPMRTHTALGALSHDRAMLSPFKNFFLLGLAYAPQFEFLPSFSASEYKFSTDQDPILLGPVPTRLKWAYRIQQQSLPAMSVDNLITLASLESKTLSNTNETALFENTPPKSFTVSLKPEEVSKEPTSSSSTTHQRVSDASEGTSIDPLLSTTWDLNSAKSIPKNLVKAIR